MSVIQSEMIGRVHLIRLPWNLDRGAAEEFARHTPDWKTKEAILHILELSEVQSLTPQFYRSVTDFKKQLQLQNIALFSVGASARLAQQLGEDGMLQLFALQTSLKEAVTALGMYQERRAEQIQLDHTFFQPLIDGVGVAIQTLNSKDPVFEPGKWMLPRSIKDPDTLSIQLGAVSEIASAQVRGKTSLYFTESALRGLFESVTRQPLDSLDSGRAQDLVREILNMAMGRAKSDWSAKHGLALERALPQSLVGDALQEHLHGFVNQAAFLPIQTATGNCYVGIQVALATPSPRTSTLGQN